MALKVTKLYSGNTEGYDKTVDYTLLSCGNIEVNSNKFYCIEIQFNPSTNQYRLYTNYGRIGSSEVHEMRGPYDSEFSARRDYDEIVAKKQKGKTGGVSKYEVIQVLSPTVGSINIRGKSATKLTIDKAPEVLIRKTASKYEPDVSRLLQQFAQENIHKITSSTSLSFTSSGLETALGPVTESHIARARDELTALQGLLKSTGTGLDKANKEVKLLNNKYLSLIPHSFGRKIKEEDWIVDDSKLIEEFDLLDQLEAAVKLGLKSDGKEEEELKGLDTDMVALADKTEHSKLISAVESTRKHSNLSHWKIKGIYSVKINKERQRFEEKGKPMGNLMDFFHGTQNGNLLSILLNGLIIPPHNASYCTGRMFGNGIYGADSSTKSLNYSVGYWSGKRNKFDNVFLLRVKFAMGKTHEPTTTVSRVPAGYHSVAAYANKTRLMNNEFIVYSLPQCTITHLIELAQR
jgi:poly [ADP-ribose] polymerase 2/3/4